MKKIKFLIASMLGAIALVFACVLGTKVNAAVINYGEPNVSKTATSTEAGNTYNLNAKYGSSSDTNADYGVYHLNFSSINFDAGSNVIQHEDLTEYLKDESASSGYGWRAKSSSGCNIQIKIGAQQSATIIIYLYYNSTNNGVSIDGSNYITSNASKVVDKVERQYVNDTNSVYTYTIAPGNKSGITYISTTTTSLASDGVSVHFDSNGGSDVDTQVIESGEKATKPANPTKANYTFDNWYTKDGTDDDWGDIFDFSTSISESITLYAKWIENTKYTVRYFVDGEEILGLDSKYTSIYDGNPITYVPTYTTYGFDGWYTSNYETKVTTVSSNISVYGKKVPLSYTLGQSDLNAETISTSITHYKNTLFSLTSGLKISSDSKDLPDGSTSTFRINTSGASYNSNTNIRTINFLAPADGKVKIYANTNTANKHINLYNPSSQDVLDSYTTAAATTVYEINFDLEKDTEYALGMDTNGSFYYIEFIPTTITPAEDAEITVTPLSQTAVVGDYTYVRFITIVSGVNEFNASDVKFQVTMEYADTEKANKTNTYTPSAVKKITSKGETYVAEVNNADYTFDNAEHANEYYVVYVLRFTTANFSGSKVYSTVTFNGNQYSSSKKTIGGIN